MQNITTMQQNGILSDMEKNDLYSKDIIQDQYVLRVENLCKCYNGNTQALNNVSFGLKTGEVNLKSLNHHLLFHSIFK